MKKFLLSIIAVSSICIMALAAENWINFDDNKNILLDKNAIKKISEDTYFLKMKILDKSEKETQKPNYTIIEEMINCKTDTIIPVHLGIYNGDGKLLAEKKKEEITQKSQKIQPEFIESKIKPKLCTGELNK